MHHSLQQFREAPVSAWIGIGIVVFYAIIAIGAPVFAPFSESASVGAQYLPWAAPHYLGTDALGRDVLSRLIYGARNTVGIALVTTALAFTLGAAFGLLAATIGGWFDAISSRAVDILMAIPPFIFALLILTICVFRSIRPLIPTTSGHLFRSIRPPVTRCREAVGWGYQI
jgi:peptide/nickel transport system permease protein